MNDSHPAGTTTLAQLRGCMPVRVLTEPAIHVM